MKSYRYLWTIKAMASALRVSVSGFYKWLSHKPSHTQTKRAQARLWVGIAHEQTRRSYGLERLQHHLVIMGVQLSLYMIRRIRKEQGLYCKRHKRYKHKGRTGSAHLYPNLLEQNFTALAPNKLWVSDITYIWTDEGWLYLAGVKDLYSKELVGYSLCHKMTASLCISALQMAITRKKPTSTLIVHSDQGGQYRSNAYHQLITKHRFRASMSAKGNCYDNAPIESFWATLKNELIYHQHYKTRNQAINDITNYIEVFYNRLRIQAALGYKAPVQFEQDFYMAT